MVSISHKTPTSRSATAIQSLVFSSPSTYSALVEATLAKGDAIAVARIAGIQAAKRTSELIPLAHPGLQITGVSVDIEPFTTDEPTTSVPQQIAKDAPYGGVLITATVGCDGKTGVEMEALTAASVAGLAMYDMLKGVDQGMSLKEGRVVGKSGGKSGNWRWDWAREKIVREGED